MNPLIQDAEHQRIVDAFRHPDITRRYHHYAIMDWSLYDRFTMPAGRILPEQIRFYEATLGECACAICGSTREATNYCSHCSSDKLIRKTRVDTNMVNSHRLPAPQRFSLNKSLYFLFSSFMAEEDRNMLMDRYHWELRLGQKAYGSGPLARFPNICPFDRLGLKDFEAPADLDMRARNEAWIAQQKEDLRQPDFRQQSNDKARAARGDREIYAPDIQIPVVLDFEWHFALDLVGNSFECKSAINIMAVMEGLIAMGIQ